MPRRKAESTSRGGICCGTEARTVASADIRSPSREWQHRCAIGPGVGKRRHIAQTNGGKRRGQGHSRGFRIAQL
jgi:hypothetical protein